MFPLDDYTSVPPPSGTQPTTVATTAPPQAPTPASGGLPVTGGDVWGLVLVGSMLLLVGLAVLSARWRRT